MKKIRILAFAIMVFSAASCVTVQNLQFNNGNEKQVDIYMNTKPEKNFNEVAFYGASASLFHSHKRVLMRLREKAKRDGIDAIIDIKFGYTFWWPTVYGVGIKYKN